MKCPKRVKSYIFVAVFVVTFVFFQFFYPYHLMRREQLTLFMYDWDYIWRTYCCLGGLSRFLGDFLTQFFYYPVAGPAIVALLLSGIALVSYKLARNLVEGRVSPDGGRVSPDGDRVSPDGSRASVVWNCVPFGFSALLTAWSFMRECGSWFDLSYTIAVLAYLSLLLAALRIIRPSLRSDADAQLCSADAAQSSARQRSAAAAQSSAQQRSAAAAQLKVKPWLRSGAAIALLIAGVLLIGAPADKESGALWNYPDLKHERVIALDVETSRMHWDKVIRLADRKDLHIDEATYYHNLAYARKGQLGEMLMNHSQHYAFGLFRWINDKESQFTITAAGEVWFYLGDMTLAEQSAMVGLEFSPRHTGARFFVRLAQINLINGDEGAAVKYLGMLSKTLTYRRWALRMMPGNQDGKTLAWLEAMRSLQAKSDFVHGDGDKRPVLRNLLEANPDNTMAREYLLCFDLLTMDLESFMSDYADAIIPAKTYQEAVLIWLSYHQMLSPNTARQYGVGSEMFLRFRHFSENPEQYRNSYWYWYMLEQQRQ